MVSNSWGIDLLLTQTLGGIYGWNFKKSQGLCNMSVLDGL